MIKEKLKNARIAKGLTQKETAKAIHRTTTNYCRKENGEIKISKIEWKKLAAFLEVSEDDIFQENEQKVVINVENQTTGENFGNYNYYSNVNEEMLAHILDYIKILKKENDELKENWSKNNFTPISSV
ncbi:helix-turn-helix domain-containing protein [Chryseobacterium sp. Y16C]|uniref:helix-turn-helix transcriptional regulator n=1 Tax=Chryseobacterium sp. Y16C TaxID=2920939 RepID=UPI001F0CC40F|nr:helix-turn-helix transcriptional regulator [Chryseobacterium sp. Y16C]UMQ43765.1 helix-turn-helix domain-containing protein [Chryseobacterium sp. Y16C]